MDRMVNDRARQWLEGGYDEQTKRRVREMMEHDRRELVESFYKTLEFGTGGLRGIMGPGTNRMNVYTVGMATQGLANYLKKEFGGKDPVKVAVSHDSRSNSRLFAETTARIFAANGFTVYLFESLRPTPELSFAIRHLGCQSGVMVTASHNPKIYNGYKAYWSDGAQVVAPHDANIIAEVNRIASIDQVRWEGGDGKIVPMGEEVDRAYMDRVLGLSLSPEAIRRNKDIKIVYTPIHGTGIMLVPAVLKLYGFDNVKVVEAQAAPDGDFPTVQSPNPEEPSALRLALDLAEREGADLVMGTDPDGDRIGIAVRDDEGKMVLLNGNQTGSLLTYYLLRRWSELGRLTGKEFIVRTIVTTELFRRIADSYGVDCYDSLTGFKYIAGLIRENEGSRRYIGGGEESYGYMIGDFVRDKDAVSACAMVAETMAWAREQGLTLFGLLKKIYVRYGFFKEGLVSIVREGKEGAEEIGRMMEDFRRNPPKSVCGSRVVKVRDYLAGKETDPVSGETRELSLPRSNVLQFVTEDSTVVSMRPSGTEPKIKFYFGVREELASEKDFAAVERKLDGKIGCIKKELKLV